MLCQTLCCTPWWRKQKWNFGRLYVSVWSRPTCSSHHVTLTLSPYRETRVYIFSPWISMDSQLCQSSCYFTPEARLKKTTKTVFAWFFCDTHLGVLSCTVRGVMLLRQPRFEETQTSQPAGSEGSTLAELTDQQLSPTCQPGEWAILEVDPSLKSSFPAAHCTEYSKSSPQSSSQTANSVIIIIFNTNKSLSFGVVCYLAIDNWYISDFKAFIAYSGK